MQQPLVGMKVKDAARKNTRSQVNITEWMMFQTLSSQQSTVEGPVLPRDLERIQVKTIFEILGSALFWYRFRHLIGFWLLLAYFFCGLITIGFKNHVP